MMRLRRTILAGAAVAGCLALVGAAMARGETRATGLHAQLPFAELNAEEHAERLEEGRRVYERHCIGCHGADGRGGGEAARLLHPAPRDFARGQFKFAASDASGRFDRRMAYRVVTQGLEGTAMSGFPDLPMEAREAVVLYLETFAGATESEGVWLEPEPGAAPQPLPPDPFENEPELGVQYGELVYHAQALCIACHPAYRRGPDLEKMLGTVGLSLQELRPNLDRALPVPDTRGRYAMPPDFRRDPVKFGRTLADLYTTIAHGLKGTAMPAWQNALTPEQIWAVSRYIDAQTRRRSERLDPATYEPRPPVDLRRMKPEPTSEAAPPDAFEDFEDAFDDD